MILCTGASYDMNMDKVVADTAHIYHLMNLPKAQTLPPECTDLAACVKEQNFEKLEMYVMDLLMGD